MQIEPWKIICQENNILNCYTISGNNIL